MKDIKTGSTRHGLVGHQMKGNDAGSEYKGSVVGNAPQGAGYQRKYNDRDYVYSLFKSGPRGEIDYAAYEHVIANADRYGDETLYAMYDDAVAAYERTEYDAAYAKIADCVRYIRRSYGKAA